MKRNVQNATDNDTPSTSSTEEKLIDATLKKRGSKPASAEAYLSATKPEMQKMLGNVLYWYKRPIVQSDEECAQRLEEFFAHIAQTGELPTVEKMCLSLGAVRSTVWEWEQGSKGKTRMNIIKRAKEILAALDAELVSNNKIPQVTYIFRAKNFYAMADKTEVVFTPNAPYEQGEVSDVDQVVQALPDVTDE